MHRPYLEFNYYSVSACHEFGHCIKLAQHSVYHIQIIILDFVLVQLCLFQLYSILHAQYLQVLTYTCATSSRDVGSGSQHPDHA